MRLWLFLADEVMEEKPEEKTSGATKPAEASSSTTDPAMADVPRSMHEIYEISNKNRKRNKEKRKLKEDSKETATEPFSPVKFAASDESFDGAENDSMQGTHARLTTSPSTLRSPAISLSGQAVARSRSSTT